MDDLIFCIKRARDGTRTRDPHLGKVVLHQLSHSRLVPAFSSLRRKNGANLSQLKILTVLANNGYSIGILAISQGIF